jgi:uncharacterized protein YaaN involved in tellurite resistance
MSKTLGGCNLYTTGVAQLTEDHLAMGDSLKIGKAAATGKATGILAADADAPASESNSLVLVPPAPPAIVEEPQAANSIKLDAPTLAKLDRLAADYVVAISQLDIRDPKFESRIEDIRQLGEDDIKASAQASSRLLDRPVGSMQKGGIAVTGTVATNLLQLRKQIDALNPGSQGDLFATRKIMGRVLPFGDRLRGYFAKYQSSQSQINAIVAGLERGQGELVKDNTDLEHEKENLWQTMERLRQYIYLAQKLDNSLTERIAKVEAKDPERAKILREDMQFYVRQKLQDLTAQMAVSVQGYLSIDVIRRNNLELVRGVDRATTTTVSALRTAVIVAQALGDQKLVLDQITALNSTTSNLIESTSVMLRDQSGKINEQAASASVDLEKLQAAFDNIYATMDEIDAYKLKALDTMSKTAVALAGQIGKAQSYLDRAKVGTAS